MTRRFLHGASWGQCCQLFLGAVAVVALGPLHALVAATFDFDGLPMTVPDGFLIERIAAPPLVERPVSIDFDEQGWLYVSESSGSNAKLVEQQTDPRHRILRLEDSDGDGIFDRRTVFADRLMMLQGTLWHQGSLYVSAAPEILRLTDTDGDGVADERTVWHDGKTLTGCGNDLHGPALGRDGQFYFTKGAFAEQTHDLIGQPGWTSRASHIFRARPDGGDLEAVLTGGMDNPVDVAFTSMGERLLSATFLQRPADGRRDGVVHAIYGGVYGKDHGVLAGHARTGDLMPVLVHLSAAAACGLHVHSGYGLGEEFRDNAFVCSFNLRGVSRHTLSPEAASFATRDEPFLTADSADFHPTDVIEDADGSLVIVDTGGWYKLCCPTSQFEKPTVLGGIYRIRPANAANMTHATDHCGHRIDWSTLDAESLAQLLADPRPAVVKQATERLARLGPAAIDPIASLLSSANRDARQAALWTLARFDDDASRAAARRGLVDPDLTVRHVAAHVAAIFRDEDAVAMLSEMVTRDTAEVARAAAAAIATADLSAADFEAVAATFTKLPSSDVATLLPVITAREGLPLVHAIGALTRSLYPDKIPRKLLAAAVAALPAEEASRGPELLARVDAARAAERAAYTRLLARLPTGDPTRGHAVFLSQKAACTTCHAMGYAGGRVGPDLTKIGGVRTPADLLEAIVLPSASFVRSDEPVVVLTDDGRSFAGIIREETAAEVMLQTSATATERIPRDGIESLQAGTVSLMPKGYDTLLTPQEVADLVAFLARAK